MPDLPDDDRVPPLGDPARAVVEVGGGRGGDGVAQPRAVERAHREVVVGEHPGDAGECADQRPTRTEDPAAALGDRSGTAIGIEAHDQPRAAVRRVREGPEDLPVRLAGGGVGPAGADVAHDGERVEHDAAVGQRPRERGQREPADGARRRGR